MKKQLVLLVLLFVPLLVSADVTAVVDGIYYNFNSDTKKAEVTSNPNKYLGSVEIPSTTVFKGDEYSVTSIGYSAFLGCSGLTSVSIPNSVTSIGGLAFSGCTGLSSVALPNSVTTIGSSAFSSCKGLTTINIPDKVSEIGEYVFYNCSGLTSVSIPNNVKSIDSFSFENCTGLVAISIPNSVTTIGQAAFSKCSNLASVEIPNSVETIGIEAFYATAWFNNQPDGLVYAGKVAYKYKGTMPDGTTVIINDGTKGISEKAFGNCVGLISVTIPNSMSTIGREAFKGCSGLTSITIPQYVTAIGGSAFEGCNSLKTVTINSNSLVSRTYSYSFNLASIFACKVNEYILGDNVRSIGKHAFRGCSFTKINIPNSVTSIGEAAFMNCSGLTTITIPNSVTSIGVSAFQGCSNLITIDIPESVTFIGEAALLGTAWYNNQPDGLVYAGKFAYKYKGTMQSNTFIIIEDGTIGITDYAFYRCTGLTKIEIPNSVTNIGVGAFYECIGLGSVDFPNSVTTIGNKSFYGCTSITSEDFPNGVTSIGESAFYGCTSLASVSIPKSVNSIGYRAFYDCEGLTKLYLNSNEVANNNSNFGFGQLFGYQVKEVVIGEDVTSISGFGNIHDLTTLTIPNSVKSISDYAFYDCSKITSVICYIQEPFEINKHVFMYSPNHNEYEYFINATLYVPKGTKNKYKATPAWNMFGQNIVEMNNGPTDIKPHINEEHTDTYNLYGHRLDNPKKGLNIIRMSDGTTKMIVVK